MLDGGDTTMTATVRYPRAASVYELMRTHPSARERLSAAGVTRDYLDYRLPEAARALGIQVERLTEIVEPAASGR